MSAAPASYGKVAMRGAALTGAAQAFKVAIRFLSVIVMARLLVPEDFGLIAAVAPLIALVALFQNLGLQQAVVQRTDISARQINAVFWVTVAVGLACTAAILVLSPLAGALYDDPRISTIAAVACVSLLLESAAAVPVALLTRRFQFGLLAFNDATAALAGLLAAAAGAYAGLGYWSLVIGTMVTSLVMLLAAWRAARWLPSRPDLRLEREIFSFGANLTGANVLNFLARNADNVLIGKYAGVVELGLYDRAYKLLMFPLQNVVTPLSRIMVPVLSRVRDDARRFRRAYLRAVTILMLAIVPGFAALAITAREVVVVLFGERWLEIVPIFRWLGVAAIIQPLMVTSAWLFISLGRTREQLRLGAAFSAFVVSAFVAGLAWGGAGVAAAYAISTFIALPFRWWYLARISPIRWRDSAALQLPYLAAGSATALVLWKWPFAVALPDLGRVALALGVSYAFAVVAALFTESGRLGLTELSAMLRSSLARFHTGRALKAPRM